MATREELTTSTQRSLWQTREGKREPPRVLVADDDAGLHRLVSAAVRADGYEVVEARDGAEILSQLGSVAATPRDRPFDLIISDVRMPGLSGLELLAGLRDTDLETPFVLITAYGNRELTDEAYRLGADAVFQKPFDVDDLRTAVVNLSCRRRNTGAPVEAAPTAGGKLLIASDAPARLPRPGRGRR